jgi:hypothetical protein
MRAQSRKAIGYLLEQLHQLGAELSTTTSLIEVPDVELMRLAEQSPDRSPHRLDEPYRRAIAGFYARLAATALALDGLEAPRHAVGRGRALCQCRRVRRRPRRAAPFADQPQMRPARARPAAPPAPCRRHLRLPPGAARPAAELRRACAHRGRTAGDRAPRHRLPRAGRERPHRAAARRARHAAAADGARRRTTRTRRAASWRSSMPRAASTGASARRRSRTSSSPRPTAFRTSSKWPCC